MTPMTPWQNRTNPLIQRMAEDRLLRNLAQKTNDSYTYHIGRFAQFIGKPVEDATPEHVLKYLARYLTGGPISDRRLISHENDEVTFWARTGTTTGGDHRREPLTLPRPEFVRRWSLHILPKNYTKTRRFGG